MPSLKAIRRRISSVKNTQKITKAMKAVAAARLRRAQDAITDLRPYATRLGGVIAEVSARAGEVHPLLKVRPQKRVELIVLTSDRGLCGGFNANISRRAERFVVEQKARNEAAEAAGGAEGFTDLDADGRPDGQMFVDLSVVGRKGRDYFKRRNYNLRHEYVGVFGDVSLERAKEISAEVMKDYAEAKLDAVYIVYNEFKSAMSQKVVTERLLPIEPIALPEDGGLLDSLYEPSKEAILETLVPMYVQTQVYRAILESIASEFGARMTAMGNATSNASDMIGQLTLEYNRARQAAITKELMEIIGGAEALKG